MNYQEALEYLNSFVNYEKDPNYVYGDIKLERMKELMEKLGNPQDTFKSIHIAGTKGKGSTCAFIFSILKAAGYKVGLYTSPHLIDLKERIKVSYQDEMEETRERLIDQGELAALVKKIKPYAQEIEGLTFFEIFTAIAFMFFAHRKVEIAVLETGLGGRLDATNVVKPIACGLSSISHDHTNLLGKNITEIAREKAGIIKEDAMVATVTQPPQVSQEIENICKEKNAKLYEIGKTFILDSIGQNLDGSTFDFRGEFATYQNMHISLIGPFQLVNVALALAIIQILRLHEIVVSSLAIKKGLEDTHWPGRMHVIHKKPFLVLDGAQNLASAQALRAAVNMLFIPKKSILVLGVSKDKDIVQMMPYLCRRQNLIILTKADNPRSMDVDTLAQKLAPFGRIIKKTNTVKEAMKMAFENISSPEDMILVTGSLYIVGETFTAIKELEFPKF